MIGVKNEKSIDVLWVNEIMKAKNTERT